MKVCILTHTFPRNDKDVAAAFMREFALGLVSNNADVVVVTPYDKEFKQMNNPFKVITYKYILPESLSVLGYSRTMKADITIKRKAFILVPLLILFGTLKLLSVVAKEKIDIISVHWIIPNGLIALIVSKLTKIPYTVTLPGTDTYIVGKSIIFKFFAKIIAQNASALFSNSWWHLDKILTLGVKPKIFDVITYPVDTNKFKPLITNLSKLKDRFEIKKKDVVVLAIGRLVYKKGFKYLIEAIPKIIKKYPNTKLLVGGDGDLKQEIQNLIQSLKIEKNVRLIGTISRDEILYYYNLANIMVTPSVVDQEGNVDGRPVVILESMACGKPQIVSNLPGISDSLVNNKNALLVPQKNSNALAEAIIKLIESPKLRKKMSQQNRKMARQKFSINYIGKAYKEYFKRVLNVS